MFSFLIQVFFWDPHPTAIQQVFNELANKTRWWNQTWVSKSSSETGIKKLGDSAWWRALGLRLHAFQLMPYWATGQPVPVNYLKSCKLIWSVQPFVWRVQSKIFCRRVQLARASVNRFAELLWAEKCAKTHVFYLEPTTRCRCTSVCSRFPETTVPYWDFFHNADRVVWATGGLNMCHLSLIESWIIPNKTNTNDWTHPNSWTNSNSCWSSDTLVTPMNTQSALKTLSGLPLAIWTCPLRLIRFICEHII